MNFITCAFINIEEQPTKVGDWQGFYIKENQDKEQSLSLFGSREYYYPHPDAPEDAVLQVYKREHIESAQPGDKNYPVFYLFLQAQKVVERIASDTH